jgi:hypothetical protein
VLGDTVNVAARMEQTGIPGMIQVTASTRSLLGPDVDLVPTGGVKCKGQGVLETFLWEPTSNWVPYSCATGAVAPVTGGGAWGGGLTPRMSQNFLDALGNEELRQILAPSSSMMLGGSPASYSSTNLVAGSSGARLTESLSWTASMPCMLLHPGTAVAPTDAASLPIRQHTSAPHTRTASACALGLASHGMPDHLAAANQPAGQMDEAGIVPAVKKVEPSTRPPRTSADRSSCASHPPVLDFIADPLVSCESGSTTRLAKAPQALGRCVLGSCITLRPSSSEGTSIAGGMLTTAGAASSVIFSGSAVAAASNGGDVRDALPVISTGATAVCGDISSSLSTKQPFKKGSRSAATGALITRRSASDSGSLPPSKATGSPLLPHATRFDASDITLFHADGAAGGVSSAVNIQTSEILVIGARSAVEGLSGSDAGPAGPHSLESIPDLAFRTEVAANSQSRSPATRQPGHMMVETDASPFLLAAPGQSMVTGPLLAAQLMTADPSDSLCFADQLGDLNPITPTIIGHRAMMPHLRQTPGGADIIVTAAAAASPDAGSSGGGSLGLVTPVVPLLTPCWPHPDDGSSSGGGGAAAAPLHYLLSSASRLRQQVVSRPRACSKPSSASRGADGASESGVGNSPTGVAGTHFLKLCKAVKQRVPVANSSPLGNPLTDEDRQSPRQ